MNSDFEIYKEFGKRLAELRKERGWTQSEVAKKLNTVQSTYSGYELGTRKITLDLILQFAEIFDMSPDELLGKTEKAPEPEEPVSEAEIEEDAIKLYNALRSAGIVKEGQALTPRQIDILDAVLTILAISFE